MSDLLLKGMILGLTDMGAIHLKTTAEKIYFEIKKESDLGEAELKRASTMFKKVGLTLMVKKTV